MITTQKTLTFDNLCLSVSLSFALAPAGLCESPTIKEEQTKLLYLHFLDAQLLAEERKKERKNKHVRIRRAKKERMAATSSFRAFLNHPAGPKTVFFWAPTMKWAITIANVKDFQRPPELLSVPQQSAVALTGLIWMKYSMDITPKNYNLMAVNAAMAVTGLYQLYRRFEYDREMKKITEQSGGGEK